MGYTEGRFLVAASIAVLLALDAGPGTAASAAPGDAATPQSSVSASPVTFAERRAGDERPARPRGADSWRDALELIALAGTCAIAVAFYSAATARRTDTRAGRRGRRR